MLVRVFDVEVESKCVQQNPLCLQHLLPLILEIILRDYSSDVNELELTVREFSWKVDKRHP